MALKDGAVEVCEGLDLEGVLSREAGQLGGYQRRALLLLLLGSVVSAFSTNEFVFTIARIDTRCFIPECETSPADSEFLPSWISAAVPSSGDGVNSCQRFAASADAGPSNDTCPASWFDQTLVVGCDEHVYENTLTAVYDLGLACDEWRRSLAGSARTLGALISLPLAGMLSDRWGRRTAVAVVAFNTAWLGLVRYWSSNYVGYVISVFVEATLGAGAILACGYILIIEVVPSKYRVLLGTMSNSSFALGQIILGLLAWAVPYWRNLLLVLYVPQLLTISFFWIMPESIRWYISKGYYQKAEDTLKKIAKVNGKEMSEKSLVELRQAAEAEKRKAINNDVEKEQLLIVQVFKLKPMLLRCVVAPVWWITMTVVYFGLSINAVNIFGNPYVNYIMVAAVEIPGFWTAMFLIDRIGRRPVLMAAFWICAAGQIAFIFIPNAQYALSLTMYLMSKYGIAAVVTTLYLYTSELFPTSHRQSLFSYCSMTGRVGSIVAPLTPALGAMVWDQLPFTLFAAMALLSGVLVLLMPETRGCRLPDTMEEAAGQGSRQDGRQGSRQDGRQGSRQDGDQGRGTRDKSRGGPSTGSRRGGRSKGGGDGQHDKYEYPVHISRL